MVAPIPLVVLDFSLVINIVFVLLVFIPALIISGAKFGIFLPLNVIISVFSLGLNISYVKAILTEGQAFQSRVMILFSEFALSKNIVVDILMFVILIIVMFLVIRRIAIYPEIVCARFALDEMPSKLMCVEAELQMATITDKEAREKRIAIRKESDFLEAMSIVSKFFILAYILNTVVIVLNIFTSLIIGIVMYGQSFTAVSSSYLCFIISVGVLVQMPLFFVSIAWTLVVYRF